MNLQIELHSIYLIGINGHAAANPNSKYFPNNKQK